jgi:peptidoglycan/LPS O-acetylase OafA/YrhL
LPSSPVAAVAEHAASDAATAPAREAVRVRRHDLDWLRVLAMLAVFLFHNARFFDTDGWHVKNAERSLAATVFVGFLNTWQMPLLMLLAGAASWYALEARTARAYLLERTKRLLVPLYTVGFFVLVPPQAYWDKVTNDGFSGSFWEYYPRFLKGIRFEPGLGFLDFWHGHLWFLRSLFLYSLIGLPLLLFLKSRTGRRWTAQLAGWCGKAAGLFLFVVPILMVQVGLRPLCSGYDPAVADLLYLLVFFLVGYVLMADDRLTVAVRRHGTIGLVLGVAGFLALVYLVLGYGYRGWGRPDRSMVCLVFFTVASLTTWCWIVFFLSLAARHLSRNSKLLTYANEAVLPFYVLHQTVILAVGRYVVLWPVSMALKYAIIVMLSFIAIMVTYELLVRRVSVLRVVFGMRPRASATWDGGQNPGALVSA